MGSGRYASEGWTQAGWVAHMRYLNTSNSLLQGDIDTQFLTDPACWSIQYNSTADDYFYFGGPGFTFLGYGACLP